MGDDPTRATRRNDGRNPDVVVAPPPPPPDFTTFRATPVLPGGPTLSSHAVLAALYHPQPTHVLMIAHSCADFACRTPGCNLCACAARRRCDRVRALTPVIDPHLGVRLPCGAVMDIDVVSTEGTGTKVVDAPAGTTVKLLLVPTAAYDAAVLRKVWQPPVDDVVPVLATATPTRRRHGPAYHKLNPQGPMQTLRAQGAGAPAGPGPAQSSNNRAAQPVPMDTDIQANEASFSAFSNTPQPGEEWNVRPETPGMPVRLVAVLVDDATGAVRPRVQPAVSKSFVIHSQPRRLVKPEIARTVDLVTVLPGIGFSAVNRLAALNHAVNPALRLPAPLHAIRTVGDFKLLADHCARDPSLDDGVRSALSLSRSKWTKAKEAAAAAVEPDNRLRAYYTTSYNRALIFACHEGCVDLNTPIAALIAIADTPANVPPDTVTRPCSSVPGSVIFAYKPLDLNDISHNDLTRVRRQARGAWMSVGHPRWTIMTGGGRHFTTLDELWGYMAGRKVGRAPTLEVHVD